MPEETLTTTRGRTNQRRLWARAMKYCSIFWATSKSAMTPSLSGRMATMVPGRAPEHGLGLAAHGQHGAVGLAQGDDGRLVEDDALAVDEDQGVGRAQIDGQIAGEHPAEPREHRMLLSRLVSGRKRSGGPPVPERVSRPLPFARGDSRSSTSRPIRGARRSAAGSDAARVARGSGGRRGAGGGDGADRRSRRSARSRAT